VLYAGQHARDCKRDESGYKSVLDRGGGTAVTRQAQQNCLDDLLHARRTLSSR